MFRRNTGYRLIAVMIMIALLQIWLVGVVLGPLNPDVFFTHQKADEFAVVSKELLEDKSVGDKIRLMKSHFAASAKEEKNASDSAISIFMRKNNVLQCQIDYRRNTVSWCFTGYYRVFANYVYFQPSTREMVSDLTVKTDHSCLQIHENWWYYVN